MQNSNQYLQNKGILPKISFKDGKKHKVKLLRDKVDTITDANGVVKEGIKYLVEEDGVPKSFFTSSVGLIQRLSECPENTEVFIQMKSKKGEKGFISYYDVSRTEDGEIPIVEDQHYEDQSELHQGVF